MIRHAKSLQITRICDRAREQQVQAVETEYFAWVNTQLQAEFQITLDTAAMLERDMRQMEVYFPPQGGLFLAELDGAVVGMICLTQLPSGAGQIRRMYVRDAYRRRGIAKALFEVAIGLARDLGYAQLLLETPKSWVGAHALYRALGFEAVEMYPEGEVPEHLRAYWVFMRLGL